MSAGSTSGNPAHAKLVEKQLRNWEIARSQRPTPPPVRKKEVEDFIAISRAVGAGGAAGSQIVSVLGAKLGWPVFNKEILQAMAADDPTLERIYDSMDERDLSWVEESLRSLVEGSFKKNDYFRRLTTTVLALARQGPAVFRGRAVDLILPRDRGFRVRLTASPASCIRNYAEHHEIDLGRARTELARIETDRAEFVRHHFAIDPAEQSRHDLIINLDRFTADQAVELILRGLKMRGMVG
ncbi:MAG TPA: cytidylate kinase family protein [Phycisphaerae bacterium]|nr:cytidylate kinase family protein [Phycisphaerae bacterium]